MAEPVSAHGHLHPPVAGLRRCHGDDDGQHPHLILVEQLQQRDPVRCHEVVGQHDQREVPQVEAVGACADPSQQTYVTPPGESCGADEACTHQQQAYQGSAEGEERLAAGGFGPCGEGEQSDGRQARRRHQQRQPAASTTAAVSWTREAGTSAFRAPELPEAWPDASPAAPALTGASSGRLWG